MEGLDTPGLTIRPSLSRRSSRPTSLHIDPSQKLDVELETTPDLSKLKANDLLVPPCIIQELTVTSNRPSAHNPPHHQAVNSPCFVHSHLDKGASLTDWLRNKQHAMNGSDLGVAKSLQHQTGPNLQHRDTYPAHSARTSAVDSDGDEDRTEDGFAGSLTKQLAETAVGVREMSKQLGAPVIMFSQRPVKCNQS